MREVDDLFELMNQEDDLYKNKRQKTTPTVDIVQPQPQKKVDLTKTQVDVIKPKDESNTFDAAMAAIKMMNRKALVTEKVKFAGQTFTTNRAKNSYDIKKEQAIQKKKLGGACDALD